MVSEEFSISSLSVNKGQFPISLVLLWVCLFATFLVAPSNFKSSFCIQLIMNLFVSFKIMEIVQISGY